MKDFREMKRCGEKITALTAYDYPTARLLDESGIDIILVGDSVGMVVLGYQDTTDVTLDEMLHHTRAAARGVKEALLVADMPIHSYDTPVQAAAESGAVLLLLHLSVYQLSAKRTTAPESLKSSSKSLTVFFSRNKTRFGRISASGRSTKVLKCSRGCGSCNRSSLIRWSPQ